MAVLYAGLFWLALAEGSLHITSGPSFLRCIIQFMMGVLLYRLYQEGLLLAGCPVTAPSWQRPWRPSSSCPSRR